MSDKPKAMSASEFNAALAALALSVYASPDIIGCSLRQAQRYSAGESSVPRPTAKLLRLALRLHLTAAYLRAL